MNGHQMLVSQCTEKITLPSGLKIDSLTPLEKLSRLFNRTTHVC